MLKHSLSYGIFAGFIPVSVITLSLIFSGSDRMGTSQWFGYLVMLLALTLIYFGVRQYRDNVQGGVIKFSKALLLGVIISIIAGVVYTVLWELYLSISGIDFIGQYIDGAIADLKSDDITGAELESEIAKLDKLKTQYANPLFRLPVTFSEIFPVGLLVSLISAAILKTRGPAA